MLRFFDSHQSQIDSTLGTLGAKHFTTYLVINVPRVTDQTSLDTVDNFIRMAYVDWKTSHLSYLETTKTKQVLSVNGGKRLT
jgi:hypothetical protein